MGVQSTLLCSCCEPQFPSPPAPKLGLPVSRREAAHPPPPHPCRGIGPFGVGSPHWLQVTFLPRNVSGSEARFCVGQQDLWLQGEALCPHQCPGSVPRGVHPSRWVWVRCISGVSSPAFALLSPFRGQAVRETQLPFQTQLLAPQPRQDSEAPGASTKLSALRTNSTGGRPGALQRALRTQRVSAHAAGGPGMVPPPLLDLDSVPVQIIVFFF